VGNGGGEAPSGHSLGLQVVRVRTRRSFVLLASDATHYYENMETMRAYPVVVDVAQLVEGIKTLQKLATSTNHVIPGHDPLVLATYPAVPGLEGIVARLDAHPK
jgi:hypothetical protein